MVYFPNELDDGVFEKYTHFCKKYGLDSSTPKSCEIFKIFLKYEIQLPDSDVKATLKQIQEVYHFARWT
jgi:hypothetical protein